MMIVITNGARRLTPHARGVFVLYERLQQTVIGKTWEAGSGLGRVTRCLGPRADSGGKTTRHNNLVRSLTDRAHVHCFRCT